MFHLKYDSVKKLFTNISMALVIGAMIFMASCSESTDPLPISKADFKITSVSPEVDVPVQFENLSLNASAYVWDYGDGMKDSLAIDPEHTYDTPGTYTVKMTAYTDDGQMSEALKDVKVGKRYLTGMYIININMEDENGNPWDDDGSGPDVLFQLGPDDATTLDDLVFVLIDSLNVGQFSTPIGITTDDLVPADYELSNKDFFILLEEIDTVNNEAVFNNMANIVFNPVVPEDDFITVTKRADGTGDIVVPFITIQQYQWLIDFEIR